MKMKEGSLPLFDLQSRSIPFLCKAKRRSSTLRNIEITEGTDFEESHFVLDGILFSLVNRNLAFELQMKSVSYQDFWYSGGVLKGFKSKSNVYLSHFIVSTGLRVNSQF
jgi:hypothetical protein